MPSAARLATAVGVGANSQRDRWSATTRLISSGIRRSKQRSPASTWATGMPSAWPRPARRRASSSCRRRRGPRRAARRRGSARARAASAPVCSALAPAADPQGVVGPRQAELARRTRRPSPRPSAGPVSTRTSSWRARSDRLQRRRLDQLRPRPDDADDAHAAERSRPATGRPDAAGRRPRRPRRPGTPTPSVRDAVGQREVARGCCGRRRPPRGPGTRPRSSSPHSGSAVWVTIAADVGRRRRPRPTASAPVRAISSSVSSGS